MIEFIDHKGFVHLYINNLFPLFSFNYKSYPYHKFPQTKCEQYWPDTGKRKTYGDITVLNARQDVFAHFTFRTLYVTYRDEARKVTNDIQRKDQYLRNLYLVEIFSNDV